MLVARSKLTEAETRSGFGVCCWSSLAKQSNCEQRVENLFDVVVSVDVPPKVLMAVEPNDDHSRIFELVYKYVKDQMISTVFWL